VSEALSLVAYGFVLGWSVAWPPGPINAEMIRRGLTHGFRPAFGVGLGACSGDALWALAVILGAGLLVTASAREALTWLSTALLFALAALFLTGAWREARSRTHDPTIEPARAAAGMRGGYFLGLGMALTSPWNLAFWLAVVGSAASQRHGITGAFVIAASVVLGAASWCLVLCMATTRLRLSFSGAAWPLIAKSATGLVMLGFALRGLWLLMR
jgi:threonine/homoserine/homoserine lactone efflux protein